MTSLNDRPQGRSQHLTFPHTRKFVLGWGGLVNATPPKLPRPEFFIGDLVFDRWTDEFDKDRIEYGEILGMSWHPREKTWVYLIEWTSGEGPDFLYPCFDEHLVIGGDLRRVDNG
jgi:hypothetical protein